MLAALVLVASTTIQVPFACNGHWMAVSPDQNGRGVLHVYQDHITVTDKEGNKIGETGDKGGTFKCEDGSDGGEDI